MLQVSPMFSGGNILPTLVAFSQNTASDVKSFIINKPTATVDGNLLIAFVVTAGGEAAAPPAGWTTAAAGGAGTSGRILAAYRVVGASEPSSYTFTTTTNEFDFAGVILTYRNAAFDSAGSIAPNNNPIVAPSIVLAENKSVLLAAFAQMDFGRTFTTPTSMTSLASNTVQTSYATFEQVVNAGSTGSRTSTASSGASGFTGVLLSIKPR